MSAGIDKINDNIDSLKGRLAAVAPLIEKCRSEVAGYEQCVSTLDRIDRKNGTRDEKAMREHYRIKAQGRRIEKSYTETPARERARGHER